MTDEELIDALCSTPWEGTPAQSDRVRDLARLGLRREREVCGRCDWQRLGATNCCAPFGLEGKVGPGDYCSRWQARTTP